jgi:uncharacterized protein YkwD
MPAPSARHAAVAALAATTLALTALTAGAGAAASNGAAAFDVAVTRRLDTPQLRTASTAARCLDSRVGSLLRAGERPTATGLAGSCGLAWARVARVRSRGSAGRVAALVRAEPGMRSALAGAGHLSVDVRRSAHRRARVVTVVVGATTASPPRVNTPPVAQFGAEATYGRLDDDPVVVTLTDSSRDYDGPIVSRTWTVAATDGSSVPVRQRADGTLGFTAAGTGVHTIRLTVTDSDGATGTSIKTLDPVDAPTEAEKLALERSIVDVTNVQRATYGGETGHTAPLSPDACLAADARAHATDMARTATLFHQEYADTLAACPEPRATAWGENVLYTSGNGSAAAVVQQWMSSSAHRANILGPYTRIGVGIHRDRSTGRLYAVQVFYRVG